MIRRCWPLLAACAVLVAGCGKPDAEQTLASASVTTIAAESAALASTGGSASSEVESTAVESASPPGARTASDASGIASAGPTTALVDQLGAAAVVPWGLVTQDDIDRALRFVSTLSVAAKAGSVLMASSADAVGTPAVSDLQLGGVILMGDGDSGSGYSGAPPAIASITDELRSQVAAEQDGFDLLVGTDQEFGLVTRLVNGFTSFPGEGELASIDDQSAAVEATQQAAAVAGAEMSAVGVNVDFAPVTDLLPVDGPSEMEGRSYGSDPQRVGALVTAAVAGYQSVGVAATLKHFPGIGELSADTHVTLSTLTADCPTWNARASVPVRAGVGAGASLVMSGHALFPAVDAGSDPTSLSTTVVTQLLRGDPAATVGDGCTPIGFRGISITDSLQMAPIAQGYSNGDAAWLALAAGQDLLLMPVRPADAVAGIEGALASGRLAESRLNEAAVRVFALRAALARTERPPLATVGSAEHQAVADRVWAAVG